MSVNAYETLVAFSLSNGEEGVTALKDKFVGLISENATLGTVEEWGKRRFAYQINDESEGYYVLINFESGPEFPAELDRIYKITDGVLRSLIIRKEEAPKQKSKEE